MEGLSLGQLFSFGQNLLTELENTSLSSIEPEYQQKVNQGITYLNQAQALVAKLHLFSDNEIIDDINTNDLKFILISAYLGDLTLKLNGKDNRANILEQAKVFFLLLLFFHDSCVYRRYLYKISLLLVKHMNLLIKKISL